MPMYVIERAFAEQLDLTSEDVKLIEEVNTDEGVRWLFSFLSADRRRSYCLYEAPSPDMIVAAAKRAGIPADAVVEVNRTPAGMYAWGASGCARDARARRFTNAKWTPTLKPTSRQGIRPWLGRPAAPPAASSAMPRSASAATAGGPSPGARPAVRTIRRAFASVERAALRATPRARRPRPP